MTIRGGIIMLEQYLEDYVNDLYEKQNNGSCLEQQGI